MFIMEPAIAAIENQESNKVTNCEVDYISHLPNSVVHKIYSRLPYRDVASTSVLSKAWNSYWYAYPYAEFRFVYNKFYPKELTNKLPVALQKRFFLEFSEYAVVRQLGREVYLHGFQMYIEFSDLSFLAPYLDRWINIAIRKGVPKFDVRVEIGGLDNSRCYYIVPQVVMQADALKELGLSGCTFGSGLEVKLPCLNKLSLHCCDFVDDLSFHTIMSGCPVIEYLKISDCGWVGKVLSLKKLPRLKHFELVRCKDIDNVKIYSTNLLTLSFQPELNQLQPQSFDLKSCRALRELKLNRLKFTENFLPEHFISQLPALEVLEFEDCIGPIDFIISSQMLNRLALRNCPELKIKEVETPNLESLEYHHSGLPFYLLNASNTLKLHLINEWIGHARGLSELQGFVSTWPFDLKLVVHRHPKSIIIHEKLNDIPLSSLSNFVHSKFICISSKSLTELMDELIPLVYPKKVYIVHSQDKTVQMLGRILNLQDKLIDFKVNTYEEDDRDLASVFLQEFFSIPPYKSSVLTLNWMVQN